ncbi:hypothetical protein ACWDR3_39600, partial [Streptomyces sp. NPDC001002]
MASDALDGLFLVLTGMKPPHAKADQILVNMRDPNVELVQQLSQLQDELAKIAQAVSRDATGQWSDAYVKAMGTFFSGEGADAIEQLKTTAKNLADYAQESAYQVDYANRMIIAQLVMFVFEWALTLIMAIWNPIGALIEQSFLRALYRLILRSVVLRLLAVLAMHQALNIGLGAAMDLLVRWSLANEGKTTKHGGSYLKQAVAFGAVQGALSPFVPFLGGALAKGLAKGLGRNTFKDLFQVLKKVNLPGSGGNTLGRNLAKDAGGAGGEGLGKTLAKDADDHLDDGAGPVPVPRPTPDSALNIKTGGLGDDVVGGAGGGFARNLSLNVGSLVDRLALGQGLDAAGRTAFRNGIGDTFANGFGKTMTSDAARDLGHTWADTLLTNLGKKNLAQELDTVLANGLPKTVSGEVRSALSFGVGKTLSTDWGRRAAVFLGRGTVEGLHQTASELIYNGATTHKADTSYGTFISGVAGGRISHVLEHNADFLGTRIKTLGLDAYKFLNPPPAYTPNDNGVPLPDYSTDDPAPRPTYPTTGTGDTTTTGHTDPDLVATRLPTPPTTPISTPTPTPISTSTSIDQPSFPSSVSIHGILAPDAGNGADPDTVAPDTDDAAYNLVASRLDTLSAPPTQIPPVSPAEHAPAAPTTQPASPLPQVRQTVARLESLARTVRMPGTDMSTLSRAVTDAAANNDWTGAARHLTDFRDRISVQSINGQLAAFDEQVADGHDRLAPLGVPQAEWQRAVEAVTEARHLGDPQVLADSLRSYTALIERHVPVDVLTGDDLPKAFSPEMADIRREFATSGGPRDMPRTVEQYQRMLDSEELRIRLHAAFEPPSDHEFVLRQRLETAPDEESANRALQDLRDHQDAQALQHRLDQLASGPTAEGTRDGDENPGDEDGDEAIARRIEALRDGNGDDTADERGAELRRRFEEADSAHEQGRALKELQDHRDDLDLQRRIADLSRIDDDIDGRPDGTAEDAALRERLLALQEGDSGPAADLRRQALDGTDEHSDTRALQLRLEILEREEVARQDRVASLRGELASLQKQLTNEQATLLTTLTTPGDQPGTPPKPGTPAPRPADRARADVARTTARIEEVQRRLDEQLLESERLDALRRQLGLPEADLENSGHLQRITQRALDLHGEQGSPDEGTSEDVLRLLTDARVPTPTRADDSPRSSDTDEPDDTHESADEPFLPTPPVRIATETDAQAPPHAERPGEQTAVLQKPPAADESNVRETEADKTEVEETEVGGAAHAAVREESADSSGAVRVGPTTTPYDAWNAFAEADPKRAADVLQSTRKLFHADLGDMDDQVRQAYAALSPRDRQRSVVDQAELLFKQALTGRSYVMAGGGWGVEAEVGDFDLVLPHGPDLPVTLLQSRTLRVAVEERSGGLPPFIELVSLPLAGVPGDHGRPSGQEFFHDFQAVWDRLHTLQLNRPARLVDVFHPTMGFAPHPAVLQARQAEQVAQIQVVRRDTTSIISPQYTVGVPAGALHDFLAFTHETSQDANNVLPYLRTGLRFGNEYARIYAAGHLETQADRLPPQVADLLLSDPDVNSLRGFLALVYTQAGAAAYDSARRTLLPDAKRILAKNFTAVLSRVPMARIRESLHPDVQNFLRYYAATIKGSFVRHFTRGLFDDEVWGTDFRNAEAQNFNPLNVLMDAHTGATVGSYLDSALWPGHPVVPQNDAFGGLSEHLDVDRNNGLLNPPLIPLELRFFRKDNATLTDFQQASTELATLHQSLYQDGQRQASRNQQAIMAERLALMTLLGASGDPGSTARSFVDFLHTMGRLDEVLPTVVRDRALLPGSPAQVRSAAYAVAIVQAFETGRAAGVEVPRVKALEDTMDNWLAYFHKVRHDSDFTEDLRLPLREAREATTRLRDSLRAVRARVQPGPVAQPTTSSNRQRRNRPWEAGPGPASSAHAVDVPVTTDDRMGHDEEWQRARAAAEVSEQRRVWLDPGPVTANGGAAGIDRIRAAQRVESAFAVRHLRYQDRPVTDLTVRVRIDPGHGLSEQQLADVRERALEGAAYLNTPGTIPRLPDGSQVHVTLQFTEEPAGTPDIQVRPHLTVNLTDDAGLPMTLNRWQAQAGPIRYAHEIAHQLGLRDSPGVPGALMGDFGRDLEPEWAQGGLTPNTFRPRDVQLLHQLIGPHPDPGPARATAPATEHKPWHLSKEHWVLTDTVDPETGRPAKEFQRVPYEPSARVLLEANGTRTGLTPLGVKDLLDQAHIHVPPGVVQDVLDHYLYDATHGAAEVVYGPHDGRRLLTDLRAAAHAELRAGQDKVLEATVEMSRLISDRYPPDRYFYFGLGRSPAAIVAALQVLGHRAESVPLSDFRPGPGDPWSVLHDAFRVGPDKRALTAEQRRMLYAHFDEFLHPHIGDGRDVLLVDYTQTGFSLFSAQHYLRQYLAERNTDVEVRALAVHQDIDTATLTRTVDMIRTPRSPLRHPLDWWFNTDLRIAWGRNTDTFPLGQDGPLADNGPVLGQAFKQEAFDGLAEHGSYKLLEQTPEQFANDRPLRRHAEDADGYRTLKELIAAHLAGPGSTQPDEYRSVRERLASLPTVTVVIDDAANFGHQAAATMMMDSLYDLGFAGRVTVIAPDSVQERLKLLVSAAMNERIDWRTDTFSLDEPDVDEQAADEQETGEQGVGEQGVGEHGADEHGADEQADGTPAGSLAGADRDRLVLVAASDRLDPYTSTAKKFLDFVDADQAVVLKPYAWADSHRLIYTRNGPDAPATFHDLEDDGTGTPLIPKNALFRFPVPKLTHAELDNLIASQVLDEHQRAGLQALFAAVHDGRLDVMPVYGLHNVAVPGRASAVSTLATGVHGAAIGTPSVVLTLGAATVPFAPRHTADWLFHADIKDPDLAERMAGLAPDQVMVVDGGRLPQDVFRQLYQLGTLPAVLEGANTSNLVQLIGRPFFSVLTHHTPYDQHDPDAARQLQSVTDAIVHASDWGNRLPDEPSWAELEVADTAESVLRSLPVRGDGRVLGQDEMARLTAALPVESITDILGDDPIVQRMVAYDPSNMRHFMRQDRDPAELVLTAEQLTRLRTVVQDDRTVKVAAVREATRTYSVAPEPARTVLVAEAISQARTEGTALHTYFRTLADQAQDPSNDQVLQALRLAFSGVPLTGDLEPAPQSPREDSEPPTPPRTPSPPPSPTRSATPDERTDRPDTPHGEDTDAEESSDDEDSGDFGAMGGLFDSDPSDNEDAGTSHPTDAEDSSDDEDAGDFGAVGGLFDSPPVSPTSPTPADRPRTPDPEDTDTSDGEGFRARALERMQRRWIKLPGRVVEDGLFTAGRSGADAEPNTLRAAVVEAHALLHPDRPAPLPEYEGLRTPDMSLADQPATVQDLFVVADHLIHHPDDRNGLLDLVRTLTDEQQPPVAQDDQAGDAIETEGAASLSTFLPESEWWLLYIDPRHHEEAQEAFRADPERFREIGRYYDEDQSPGFQQSMVEAYRAALDDESALGERMTSGVYQRLHALATSHVDGKFRWSGNGTTGFPLRNDELSADLLAERLQDRRLIAPITGSLLKNTAEPAPVTILNTFQYRNSVIQTNYRDGEAPALVDAIFDRHYAEVEESNGDDHKTLAAIARTIRALQVVHPFTDGNRRLNVQLLLFRLLLEQGLPPVISTDLHRLFQGGYSVEQMVSSLETSIATVWEEPGSSSDQDESGADADEFGGDVEERAQEPSADVPPSSGAWQELDPDDRRRLTEMVEAGPLRVPLTDEALQEAYDGLAPEWHSQPLLRRADQIADYLNSGHYRLRPGGAHSPEEQAIREQGPHTAGPSRAVADSKLFRRSPLLDLPGWHETATAFENDLVQRAVRNKPTQETVRRALGRLVEVLQVATDADDDTVLRSFVRDEAVYGTRIGTELSSDDVRRTLSEGTTSEMYTAFFNAALGDAGAGVTLRGVLNDILARADWERAESLGLDVDALREQHRVLNGPYRRIATTLLRLVSPDRASLFGADAFALGNLTSHSGTWLTDSAEPLAGPADRAVDESSWAKDLRSRGIPTRTGVSGTAALMLSAFSRLNVPAAEQPYFLKGLIAWMGVHGDHSLYEILRGAEIAGFTGTDGRQVDLTDGPSMYRTLDALGNGFQRSHVLPHNDGNEQAGLPDEAVYLDLRHDDRMKAPTEQARQIARTRYSWIQKVRTEPRRADGKMSHWLQRNGLTARTLPERIGLAHISALTVYTGGEFELINTVAKVAGLADATHPHVAHLAMRNTVQKLITQRLNRTKHDDKEISEILFADSEMSRLYAEYRKEYLNLVRRQREEPGLLDSALTAWRQEMQVKLYRRVEEILPDLVREARLHAEMVRAALHALPGVKDVTVWRGNWTLGGDSLISPFLKALPLGYNAPLITVNDFTSASRDRDTARRFARHHQVTGVSHPVLLKLDLTGAYGRDISYFSRAKKDEEEVAFLPGAQFRVTARTWAEEPGRHGEPPVRYELIEAVEVAPPRPVSRTNGPSTQRSSGVRTNRGTWESLAPAVQRQLTDMVIAKQISVSVTEQALQEAYDGLGPEWRTQPLLRRADLMADYLNTGEYFHRPGGTHGPDEQGMQEQGSGRQGPESAGTSRAMAEPKLFRRSPLLDLPGWHEAAEEFEEGLAQQAYQDGQVRGAVSHALGRLLDVLREASGGDEDAALRSFVRADASYAGQVGTALSPDEIRQLLVTGSTREMYTAFFNAAFENAEAAATFRSVLNDLLTRADWDHAQYLGLDVEALRAHHDVLNSPYRHVAHGVLRMVSPEHARFFGEDAFALGNIASRGEHWLTDSAELLASRASRVRLDSEQSARARRTPGHYRAAGAELSTREFELLRGNEDLTGTIGVIFEDVPLNTVPFDSHGFPILSSVWKQPGVVDVKFEGQPLRERFITQNVVKVVEQTRKLSELRAADLTPGTAGPEFPVMWREGRTTFDVSGSSWAKSLKSRGIPTRTGVSGTAALMLSAFRWLNVPAAEQSHFLKGLIAWMGVHGDHSLYEILRGAEIAGFTGTDGRQVDLTDGPSMYRTLDALGDGFQRSGVPRLPDEETYLRRADEEDWGSLHFATEIHQEIVDADRRGVGQGSPNLREWLANNDETPRGLLERLGVAHIYALRAYTTEKFQMINTAAASGRWANSAYPVPDLTHAAMRRVLDRMTDEYGEDGSARRPEEKLSAFVSEARLHADMLTAALHALPPVKDATVWRGNWAVGGDSLISSFLKAVPVGYNAQLITVDDFTSTSRDRGKALEFTKDHQVTGVSHPVLLKLSLTGAYGRDISLFSRAAGEKEVVFLPGARFRVTSRTWVEDGGRYGEPPLRYELIEAEEVGPTAIPTPAPVSASAHDVDVSHAPATRYPTVDDDVLTAAEPEFDAARTQLDGLPRADRVSLMRRAQHVMGADYPSPSPDRTDPPADEARYQHLYRGVLAMVAHRLHQDAGHPGAEENARALSEELRRRFGITNTVSRAPDGAGRDTLVAADVTDTAAEDRPSTSDGPQSRNPADWQARLDEHAGWRPRPDRATGRDATSDERLKAWDRYLAAHEEYETAKAERERDAAETNPHRAANASMRLASAATDLRVWSLFRPADLITEYRARIAAETTAQAQLPATNDQLTTVPDSSTITPGPLATASDPLTTTQDPSSTTPDPLAAIPDPLTTTADLPAITPAPSTNAPDPLATTPDPLTTTPPAPHPVSPDTQIQGDAPEPPAHAATTDAAPAPEAPVLDGVPPARTVVQFGEGGKTLSAEQAREIRALAEHTARAVLAEPQAGPRRPRVVVTAGGNGSRNPLLDRDRLAWRTGHYRAVLVADAFRTAFGEALRELQLASGTRFVVDASFVEVRSRARDLPAQALAAADRPQRGRCRSVLGRRPHLHPEHQTAGQAQD